MPTFSQIFDFVFTFCRKVNDFLRSRIEFGNYKRPKQKKKEKQEGSSKQEKTVQNHRRVQMVSRKKKAERKKKIPTRISKPQSKRTVRIYLKDEELVKGKGEKKLSKF